MPDDPSPPPPSAPEAFSWSTQPPRRRPARQRPTRTVKVTPGLVVRAIFGWIVIFAAVWVIVGAILPSRPSSTAVPAAAPPGLVDVLMATPDVAGTVTPCAQDRQAYAPSQANQISDALFDYRLMSAGFAGAVVTCWDLPNGDEYQVTVFDYADAGAARNALGGASLMAGLFQPSSSVETIGGGAMFSSSDAAGVLTVQYGCHDHYVFTVEASTTGAPTLNLGDIATEQYNRL